MVFFLGAYDLSCPAVNTNVSFLLILSKGIGNVFFPLGPYSILAAVISFILCFIAAPTKLQVLYSFRDYRTEGSSSSEWKEVTVRSSTEAVFHPQNAKKVRKFKLSAITSLTLSA